VIEKILMHRRLHLRLRLRALHPSGASPWPGATSGLRLLSRDCSDDPMQSAAGVS
jgi:hypothetical protein